MLWPAPCRSPSSLSVDGQVDTSAYLIAFQPEINVFLFYFAYSNCAAKIARNQFSNSLILSQNCYPLYNMPSNDISRWVRGLTFYFSLCVAVMVALHVSFSYFCLLHTDVDSARYMLSALIQGEFAVVTLVVTLSLVAMQLMAQSYSPRIIETFRRTPDLWILIAIYGFAIFFGLLVLKLIEEANSLINSQSNLEWYVAFSYYFGVFAFVALVP